MGANCLSEASVGVTSGACGIDFTIAFEDYVLILIPASCLILLAPIRLRTIWSRSIKVVTPTILQLIKTLSALAFVGFSFAILVAICVRPIIARHAEIPAAVLAFLASAIAFILSLLEHSRSIRPSKLLQLYLIVALIVQAVHLRTIWSRHDDVVLQALGIAQVVSCAAFLTTESIGKERILLTKQRRSPQDVNDLFSERLFWWLNQLFQRGYRSILAPTDLHQMDEDLCSPEINRRFRLVWFKHYNQNPEVTLPRILFSALRYDILFPIVPRLLLLAVTFAQPYLIMRLVTYIDHPTQSSTEEGILLVLATALEYTAISTFQGWYWQAVTRYQTKFRSCLTSILHDKALRCRPNANYSPLTLMNVDIERSLVGIRIIHEYWATVMSIGISLALLYLEMGVVFVAPLALLVVLISISAFNGTRVGPKQEAWFSATQKRISYITGVIAAMKNVKFLGIGPSVLKRGTELRDAEVNAQVSVRISVMLSIVISLAVYQLSTLVLYGGFAISTLLGGKPLNNTTLFTTLSLLKLFTSPLLTTIQFIPSTLQALGSLKRMQNYLISEDHEDKRRIENISAVSTQLDDSGCVLEISKAPVGYKKDSVVLTDLDCKFLSGSLNMIFGPVGSGKSTLLKTILGETVITKGSVMLRSQNVAYCDQTAWLWNATVKENVCGDANFDVSWFDRVTWACNLHEDFSQLPNGINTLVGSDGTSLSGGQKNRISLARALYSRSRLAVLDDVLSGLDAHTEKLVVMRVFGPRGIFKQTNTTVILATHAIGWLRYADYLISLDKGEIVYQGPPSSFSSPEVRSMPLPEKTESPWEKSVETVEYALQSERDVESEKLSAPAVARHSDMRVYKHYLRSFGLPCTIYYLANMAIWIGSSTMQSLWLKWWAAAAPTTPAGLGKYAGTFAGITAISCIALIVFIGFSLLILLPRSSRYLHANQWNALVMVAYAAWGAKDTGSVTNRFSQDINIVDSQLNMAFINLTSLGLQMIASTAILLVATAYIAIAIPFLLGILWAIQKVYLRTSKQLRIMDLEAKAPLCTHFLETVSGVVTINAFGWDQSYRERNTELLEKSQVPFYLLASAQNWLTLVLNFVVAGLATVVMAIAVKMRENVDAGYIGLALIEIMDLGSYCENLVVSWTTLETSLGAVARSIDFIDDMPTEEQGRVSPPPDWLSEGRVEIQGLIASYSETADPTIKDVNLTIHSGEKMAICGRTGSGKSSLASALFGLLHVRQGTIRIDGFDITEVSQDLLRSKMVAIPQDAYFTPGTVRENLSMQRLTDHIVPDSAMMAALDKVGLLSNFESLAADSSSEEGWTTALDVELSPADMLTRGQMQLFAMARAILSDGQIVLIDEATSGLDHVSESLVQELLRKEFSGRTIVAIAHHLKTILDYDTVIVMDNGRIAEIGAPDKLKDREGSLFRELLRAAE